MYHQLAKFRWLTALIIVAIASAMGVDAQGVDLNHILHQVELHTPDLQVADAETQKQQAAIKLAKSAYWGELDALVKSSNYNKELRVNPMSYPVNMRAKLFDNNQFGYGISGQLPVDINGRIADQVEAADKQLAAAVNTRSDVRLSVLHATADLYHAVAGVVALEKALQKQIGALTMHIKNITVAIATGRSALVEKLRLVAAKQEVIGKLAILNGQEQGFRARLAALMGVDSFCDSVIAIHAAPQECIAGDSDSTSRPDIDAMRQRVAAADAHSRAQFARRLPSLNMNGSWLNNQGFNGEGEHIWSLFAQLQLPLWDGGERKAAVAQAAAEKTALRHKLASLQNRARAEAVAARADWQGAAGSYLASCAALEAAQETERIQTDRFAQGRLSATDMVDAEASLTAARSNQALALTRWWQAEDHLRHAVGLPPAAYIKSVHKISTTQEPSHAI